MNIEEDDETELRIKIEDDPERHEHETNSKSANNEVSNHNPDKSLRISPTISVTTAEIGKTLDDGFSRRRRNPQDDQVLKHFKTLQEQ